MAVHAANGAHWLPAPHVTARKHDFSNFYVLGFRARVSRFQTLPRSQKVRIRVRLMQGATEFYYILYYFIILFYFIFILFYARRGFHSFQSLHNRDRHTQIRETPVRRRLCQNLTNAMRSCSFRRLGKTRGIEENESSWSMAPFTKQPQSRTV